VTATVTHPPCPTCASTDVIRIVYGEPSYEMWEAEQRGEIRLGGCFVGLESPDYECMGCGSALPWVADDDDPYDD